ncbi:hypothetical protein IP91_03198 [Pseudoduganella lurida]|uniref:Uncharacterized protein n=1 Tax=Pseudoduganella lurida TaxID=1036180 RepID=A0A562R5U2_9BURK|nr:hypothetical protein IP91_03198 [Pseudoduganella lurida]
MLLLGLWYLVKPKDAAHRLESRVDDAVALTESCRLDEARDELAALRKVPASAAQIRRVQQAISSTTAACGKKGQRARAWSDARAAMETSLAAGALDKATSRLGTFEKKWGADDTTQEWRDRIAARRAEKLLDEANVCLAKKDRACMETKLDAAEKLKRPESAARIETLRGALSRLLETTLLEGAGRPAPASSANAVVAPLRPSAPPPLTTGTADADEARKLKTEAEHELAQGNYRAAMGRAAQCATMLPGECQPLREKATRLDREFQTCMKAGREWVSERCE